MGFIEEKVGFIENTAMRHRWGGGREVTVTSRLHRQKDTERQRKTEENVERRPVVTPRYEKKPSFFPSGFWREMRLSCTIRGLGPHRRAEDSEGERG